MKQKKITKAEAKRVNEHIYRPCECCDEEMCVYCGQTKKSIEGGKKWVKEIQNLELRLYVPLLLY